MYNQITPPKKLDNQGLIDDFDRHMTKMKDFDFHMTVR